MKVKVLFLIFALTLLAVFTPIYLLAQTLNLNYSTYLGGSENDSGAAICLGPNGSAYITGSTLSFLDFPTENPYQAEYGGGTYDAFVIILSSTGSDLNYSTYLGGNDSDYGKGISVGTDGKIYIIGDTESTNFPTENPYQAGSGGRSDVFVTVLASDGSELYYSTYLGGNDSDYGRGLCLNADGKAYITGYTESGDFPTENPYQAEYGGGTSDAFVSLLSSTGSDLNYSTYLGGNDSDYGRGLCLNTDGKVYITGYTLSSNFPTENPYQAGYGGNIDAFVTALSSTGSALYYSTYIGGDRSDKGYGITLNSDGKAYVVGDTGSSNLPTKDPYQEGYRGGLFDAFVTALTSSGSELHYSSYLGGGDLDSGTGIHLGENGVIYVVGTTRSSNFPTKNPYQAGENDYDDIFLTALSSSGSALRYSTYLGGSAHDYGNGLSLGTDGTVYLTGETSSYDFPTENPYQARMEGAGDVFISSFIFVASPTPSVTPTPTITPPPSKTPTPSVTCTPSQTPTTIPTTTVPPTPSPTTTLTPPPSQTPTPQPTLTPYIATPSPTATPTPSKTPTPTPTGIPTFTPTPGTSPSLTPIPTVWPTPSTSCNFRVSGDVIDTINSSPVSEALVTMTYSDLSSDTTTSDIWGHYSFDIYNPHPPGEITLEATYPGYRAGYAYTNWGCHSVIDNLDIPLEPITPTPTPTPYNIVSWTPTSSPTPYGYKTPTPTPSIPPTPINIKAIGDYNGDGTTDLAVFRPSNSLWLIRGLTRIYFGNSEDEPLPQDYDGDGTWDLAFARPSSNLWKVKDLTKIYFGINGDLRIPTDYNGDGSADFAYFRSSNTLWNIKGTTRIYFGKTSDVPIPADYNGDGSVDPTFFRGTNGLWKVRSLTSVYFGSSSDTLIPGDYDGDGTIDFAYFRPSNGLWKARNLTRLYFGTSDDIVIPGDFNGDGTTDYGYFRPSSILWKVKDITRVYFALSDDTQVTNPSPQ